MGAMKRGGGSSKRRRGHIEGQKAYSFSGKTTNVGELKGVR